MRLSNMKVYITHAEADRTTAESLRTFLDRQGLAVELENGERGFQPRKPQDVVVALWSRESPFSPLRLSFEKQALDAWAEGRLILVKLDAHFAPVGLRDLPFIDATFENQREAVAWEEIGQRVRALPRAPVGSLPSPAPAGGRQMPPPAPQRVAPAAKAGCARGLALGLLLLAGGVATALIASIWLTNRIDSRPGGWRELGRGLNEFGARHGLPSPGGSLVAGGAAIVGLISLVILVGQAAGSSKRRPRSKSRAEAPVHGAQPRFSGGAAEASAERGAPAIFVSYARVDAASVNPICEELRRQGREIWLDTQQIDAGENWAGEIVRAIKAVRGVAVMCSKAAFESDHVKREVYLADRYKRRILPVFLEEASPPEDFEYFFAGVQWLKLQDTPVAERGPAVAKALAAVPEPVRS